MDHIYHINEIFSTLQGEGFYTGRPSIFIRFSGCNIKCPFCDTLHHKSQLYTLDQICEQINVWPNIRHVVLTGGEPGLQVDEALITALHKTGKYVAIETNGTLPIPPDIDWITCSPKVEWCNMPLVLNKCDELKVVYIGDEQDLSSYLNIQCQVRYIQPCDSKNQSQNTRTLQQAIKYCLTHPQWDLSLQTHKIIGIP